MSDPISEYLSQGYRVRSEGRLQDALAAFTQAAALSRESANMPLLAEALTAIGYTERNLKNIDSALIHYGAAVDVYRQIDEPLRLAHTMRHVADILREEGRREDAHRSYVEALAIYRSLEAVRPLDLANVLRGFALLKENLRERAAARAMWEEASTLYKTVGVQAGVEESRASVLRLSEDS